MHLSVIWTCCFILLNKGCRTTGSSAAALKNRYHIYDWRALPVSYAATLATGLRENSRIKLAISKTPVDLQTMLTAAAVDRLSLLVWAGTKDASKGRNKPKSIVEELTAYRDMDASDIAAYATGADFERARKKILKEEVPYGH